VLASLFEPIKAELHLSDAELGVLGGLAVSLFGACFGVHIARAADRRARRAGVLAACLTAWSVATAASGAARGFGGLLAARVCVGVGEAGAIPISLALLADAYPQAQRSSAMSVYYTGIPAGILLGLFLGGWLAQSCGWRGAFCAVGVPGLALAALLAVRLREPPRGHADKADAAHGGEGDDVQTAEADDASLLREGQLSDVQARRAALPPPLQLQLLALARCRTFVHVLLGGALNLFTAIGTFAFMPSLLGRRFGTPPGVAGSALSGVMLFAAASTLAGGAACDAAFRKRGALSVYALLPAAVVALAFPFGVAMCAARSLPATVLLFLPPTAAANVGSGPLRCLVSALVPPNSRGAANSVLEVGIGFAGGLGPLVVGAVSDALQRRGRSPGDALALAMLSIQFAALPAALCLWRAAANAERDARRAKAGGGGSSVAPADEDDAA
jgi:MFS family permease